jgi:hypothetical protein
VLPPITSSIWVELVTGARELRSANIAINLLLFNSKLRYKRDPSKANVTLLVIHAYEVFKKQEPILEGELDQLSVTRP